MAPLRIFAIILVLAGLAAIAVRSVTYTKETHNAEIGPLSVSVSEKERVGIPMWAGIAAIVVGVGLFFVPAKR